VPFVTKYWFGLTVLFTLMGRLSIIWGQWVVLQWYPVVHQFQVRQGSIL
jgi:hypothetical protein